MSQLAPAITTATGTLNKTYRKGGAVAEPRDKVEKTLHEFKHGDLHSGSKHGPKVTSRKQAIAIALEQQRKEDEDTGGLSSAVKRRTAKIKSRHG